MGMLDLFSHLVTRLAAVAAVVLAGVGFAIPAHAEPSVVSVVSKCGYAEFTVVSDKSWSFEMNIVSGLAGSADAEGRVLSIEPGTNIFTVMFSKPLTGNYYLWYRDGGARGTFAHTPPQGCQTAKLATEFEVLCGGQVLATVTNSGTVAAEHVYINLYNGLLVRDAEARASAVSDVVVPVGVSRFVVDGLEHAEGYIPAAFVGYGPATSATDLTWAGSVTYREPAHCTTAPKVTFIDSCTTASISTEPADSDVTTVVFGQMTPDRPVTGRTITMAAGESLLVTAGAKTTAAHRFTPSDCPAAQAPAPPAGQAGGGQLAITGDRTAVSLAVALALLTGGATALFLSRRRRVS